MLLFSRNDWNVEHIAGHGVTPEEAEFVVKYARPPFPDKIGGGKWRVWGRTRSGRYLQVIFVFPPDRDVDADSLSVADLIAFSAGEGKVVYVIHALELGRDQIRQFRKR